MSVQYCVKVRGLPWSCKPSDLLKFFDDVEVAGGIEGVHLCIGRDGRFNGEGFVALVSERDLDLAIRHDRQNMGKRYIEVFRGDPKEASWYIDRRTQEEPGGEGVVRLRGLPFGVTKEEIAHFFSGLEIVPNGIWVLTDDLGRPSGDAFVQFVSEDVADRAREEKDKERIGHRYIEIFKSSLIEVRAAVQPRETYAPRYDDAGGYPEWTPVGYSQSASCWPSDWQEPHRGHGDADRDHHRDHRDRDRQRPSYRHQAAPYPPTWLQSRYDNYTGTSVGSRFADRDRRSRPSNSHSDRDLYTPSGCSVHLRGLPYDCTDGQIYEFFAPLRPTRVHVPRMKNGKATGEADVEFATREEAQFALQKDHQSIGYRYIELFLNKVSDNAAEARYPAAPVGPAPRSSVPGFGVPAYGLY